MTAKKNSCWTWRFAEESGVPRKLWRSLNTLLRRDEDSQPSAAAVSLTADGFAQFFEEKVEGCSCWHCSVSTANTVLNVIVVTVRAACVCSEEVVRRVLLSSPTKSCTLDPTPTFFAEGIDC